MTALYLEEAKLSSELLGDKMFVDFKLLDGCDPFSKENLTEMYLNNNWRPCLAVTGAEGLPSLDKAGNVIRSFTTLKVKIRLPPTLNAKKAVEEVIKVVTEDPPHGAKVEISEVTSGNGFCMKDLSEKTRKALNDASLTFFSKDYGVYGCGGAIPFLQTLGDIFTKTEILSLGVTCIDSYIHAPNENLHLPYVKNLICVLSHSLVSLSE